ncbi:hypothetical protein ACOSP7_016089 [Xanthoceras sorbifolium]
MINMIVKQNEQTCHNLKYDNSEDQIVAECRISSTNPKDKIHNMPLERGYWRVWIDAVFIDIKQRTVYVILNGYSNVQNSINSIL